MATAEYQREWRARNREHARAQARASARRYLENNREKHNARMRGYYQRKRDERAALEAAAARVVALWAECANRHWIDRAEMAVAVAQLAALLPEER